MIQEQIDKAENIVINDLNSKKLGNQPQPATEPEGPISKAVKDSTLTLDIKNATVK